MEVPPGLWGERLARAFPGTDWSQASQAHGAFHGVILSPGQGLVARVLGGTRHQARATLEHRTAEACSTLRLSVAVPRTLGAPVSSRTHSAYLLQFLPGHARHEATWSPGVADALVALLAELAGARPPRGLREPRGWAGGAAWPVLVDQLVHGWPRAERGRAMRAVHEAVELTHDGPDVLVHGDFGAHNVLWDRERPVALIDWDCACVASQVIDVAPLVGHFGVTRLATVLPRDTVAAAARYRASLPLQVAVAAGLVGDASLRAHALNNFRRRFADGTLTDPYPT